MNFNRWMLYRQISKFKLDWIKMNWNFMLTIKMIYLNDFFQTWQTIDITFIISKLNEEEWKDTQVRCHVLSFCYVHNQIFLINTTIEHGIHAPYIFSLTCSIRINLIACHPWYVSLNWHATWTCQIFIPSHLRYNYLVN